MNITSDEFGSGWTLLSLPASTRASTLANSTAQTAEYSLNGQLRVIADVGTPTWYPYSMGFVAHLLNPQQETQMMSNIQDQVPIISIAAAAGIIVSFFIVRGISNGIVRTTKAAQLMSSGDLVVKFDNNDKKGGDEVGEHTRSFDTMSPSIRDLIGKVSTAAANVTEHAEVLGSSAQALIVSSNQLPVDLTDKLRRSESG